MSVTRIATRYAKSLIDLAKEQGSLDAVHGDMVMINEAAKNKELALLLKSPIIQADKKNAVLEAIFGGKTSALTMAYLRLLVEKGREPLIPEIVAEFVAQYKLLNKITSVRIISAQPLTDSVMQDLKDRMVKSGVTFENLQIETHIDPSLIGGFILEFDNKRYDASVSHKLESLKAEFNKNLYIKDF